jgi:beta-1,4-mannosyl-glycoprotein beta-1,4-N-acetylglucosaminyltransferase
MGCKIYDCFIFNDEIDILHQRLLEYIDIVDGFIIAESKHSFDGGKKPLWARGFLEQHPSLSNKVQLIEYSFPSKLLEADRNDRWGREKFARQALALPISRLPDEAFVILSDVDEFPSVAQIHNSISNNFISSAQTPVVVGKINLFSESDVNWNTVRIGPKSLFQDLNSIRYMKAPKTQGELGIHLTWQFGNFEEFVKKVRTTAHSEFDQDPKLVDLIFNFSQKYQVSHLGRFQRNGFGFLKFIPRDSLSPLQISLLARRPDWHQANQVEVARWKRFCASYLISRAWKTGEFPSDQNVNLSTFLRAVSSYWLSKTKMTKRRIMRIFRLTKLKSLFS